MSRVFVCNLAKPKVLSMFHTFCLQLSLLNCIFPRFCNQQIRLHENMSLHQLSWATIMIKNNKNYVPVILFTIFAENCINLEFSGTVVNSQMPVML